MPENRKMRLRPAEMTDDKDLWQWRNDRISRKNSFHDAHIPLGRHRRWLRGVLKNSKQIILVATQGKNKIGMIRFDFLPERLIQVSINLNPVFRGRGFGRKILKQASDRMKRLHPKLLQKALIRGLNVSSEKIFRAAGFVKIHHLADLNYSVWIRL